MAYPERFRSTVLAVKEAFNLYGLTPSYTSETHCVFQCTAYNQDGVSVLTLTTRSTGMNTLTVDVAGDEVIHIVNKPLEVNIPDSLDESQRKYIAHLMRRAGGR